MFQNTDITIVSHIVATLSVRFLGVVCLLYTVIDNQDILYLLKWHPYGLNSFQKALPSKYTYNRRVEIEIRIDITYFPS